MTRYRKKKGRRSAMPMYRKVGKGIAGGVATGLIAAPAIIPAMIIGKNLAAGHTVAFSVNSATQAIAGMSMDGGDMTVDFGKVTKYAVGSAGLVLLGLGVRKFIQKRI